MTIPPQQYAPPPPQHAPAPYPPQPAPQLLATGPHAQPGWPVHLTNGAGATTPATIPFTFTGGGIEHVLMTLVAGLLIVFTFGLALPWAVAMLYGWEARHVMVGGRPVRFTGTGLGLFGQWIKWWLLTVITLGVYSFFIPARLMKWRYEHMQVVA